MREILLGFDAVKRWTDIPDNYRSTFLLRDDIDSLVSADSRLCDPVVERGNEWIGMNTHFWENIEHLERHLPNGVPYILMAATWHLQAREISGMLGPHESTTYPIHRDPAWNLLGYDINDPGISGLSNCGYLEEERRELARIWAPSLNSHHLFDDLEHAFEFRALTNARVPEHAPFFVIGLWLIREVE